MNFVLEANRTHICQAIPVSYMTHVTARRAQDLNDRRSRAANADRRGLRGTPAAAVVLVMVCVTIAGCSDEQDELVLANESPTSDDVSTSAEDPQPNGAEDSGPDAPEAADNKAENSTTDIEPLTDMNGAADTGESQLHEPSTVTWEISSPCEPDAAVCADITHFDWKDPAEGAAPCPSLDLIASSDASELEQQYDDHYEAIIASWRRCLSLAEPPSLDVGCAGPTFFAEGSPPEVFTMWGEPSGEWDMDQPHAQAARAAAECAVETVELLLGGDIADAKEMVMPLPPLTKSQLDRLRQHARQAGVRTGELTFEALAFVLGASVANTWNGGWALLYSSGDEYAADPTIFLLPMFQPLADPATAQITTHNRWYLPAATVCSIDDLLWGLGGVSSCDVISPEWASLWNQNHILAHYANHFHQGLYVNNPTDTFATHANLEALTGTSRGV